MRTHFPTTPQQLMRRFLVCSIVGLALLLAACGGSESESQNTSSADAAAQEQELQERADELEQREKEAAERERKAREREREARQAEREARRKEREARKKNRAEAAAPPSAPASSGSGGGITVPNVVGLDHQAAQDALQGEGLYNLDERDCTGQGRLLLFDRNWEVVSTDPPAGAAVSEDAKITLCSVKQGEQ